MKRAVALVRCAHGCFSEPDSRSYRRRVSAAQCVVHKGAGYARRPWRWSTGRLRRSRLQSCDRSPDGASRLRNDEQIQNLSSVRESTHSIRNVRAKSGRRLDLAIRLEQEPHVPLTLIDSVLRRGSQWRRQGAHRKEHALRATARAGQVVFDGAWAMSRRARGIAGRRSCSRPPPFGQGCNHCRRARSTR